MTTAQKNATRESAKGQRFTTEGAGDGGGGVSGGGSHAHPGHSSRLTPTSDSHFDFLSFLIQEGRHYITSFVSLKRFFFLTHPFILLIQPAYKYLLNTNLWELGISAEVVSAPNARVPVGGRNENSYLAWRVPHKP